MLLPPGAGHQSGGASRTGTFPEQAVEREDPGPMAVAPVDPEPVGSHQLDGHGPDVCRDPGGVEQGPASHLLDALGAGAGQAELPGGVERLVASAIPVEQEAVVPTRDGLGQGYL